MQSNRKQQAARRAHAHAEVLRKVADFEMTFRMFSLRFEGGEEVAERATLVSGLGGELPHSE